MELTQEEVENFQVPGCPKCGGILKPYVVFFGDNVPRGRVEEARREVSKSDKLLGKRYIKTLSEELTILNTKFLLCSYWDKSLRLLGLQIYKPGKN